MNADPWTFRARREALTHPLAADALRAWPTEHPGERAWVLALGARRGDPL